jgi:hypothetical protein
VKNVTHGQLYGARNPAASLHFFHHILYLHTYFFRITLQSISITTTKMPTPRPRSKSAGGSTSSRSKRTKVSREIELSPVNIEILNIIEKTVDARGPDYKHPFIICSTDIGRDFDDLGGHCMLSELDDLGATISKLFIPNLTNAEERTHYERCILKVLGMENAEAVCGTNGYLNSKDKRVTMHTVNEYECNEKVMSILDRKIKYKSGSIKGTYEQAEREGRKVIWLAMSSLADLRKFQIKEPALFLRVTEKVVFQGGCTLNSKGTLIPDNATNNTYDMTSAKACLKFLSDNKVETVTYTRVAASAVQLSGGFFNDLADIGHILGETFLEMSSKLWEVWWRNANGPEEGRHKPDHTAKWFVETCTDWFKTNPGRMPGEDDDIISYCKPVFYDALAALGVSGDDILENLGVLRKPLREDPRQSETHRIVGLVAAKDGSKKDKDGNDKDEKEIAAMEKDKVKSPLDYMDDIGVNPERMAQVIETLLKAALLRTLSLSNEAKEAIAAREAKARSRSRSRSRSTVRSPSRSDGSTRSHKSTDSTHRGRSRSTHSSQGEAREGKRTSSTSGGKGKGGSSTRGD